MTPPIRKEGPMTASITAARPTGEAEFVEAMSAVTQPVAVVTAATTEKPFGLTVGSFVSVSVQPMLISVSLNNQSLTLDSAEQTRRIGVNLLGAGGRAIAVQFARSGIDRFAGIIWRWDRGLPRLGQGQIWIPCSVERLVPAGDHTIVIARVDGVEQVPGATLAYRARSYVTTTPIPADEI